MDISVAENEFANCSFTNTSDLGRVTVEKRTFDGVDEVTTTDSFTIRGDVGPFVLDTDALSSTPSEDSVLRSDGAVTVLEDPTDGWVFDRVECTERSARADFSVSAASDGVAQGVSFQLEPGDQVRCVFFNNTVVTTGADLSVTKFDDVDPIVAGNTLTYTVTVFNAGPEDATNVVVTDTLPAGVSFVSTSGCGEDPSGVASCSLGDIASGGSAQYTITVTVAAATSGTITNSVSISSDTSDPNASNDTASEDTTVSAPPPPEADLSVTKSDDVDPIVAGNTLTYTVTVFNAGPEDATTWWSRTRCRRASASSRRAAAAKTRAGSRAARWARSPRADRRSTRSR